MTYSSLNAAYSSYKRSVLSGQLTIVSSSSAFTRTGPWVFYLKSQVVKETTVFLVCFLKKTKVYLIT